MPYSPMELAEAFLKTGELADALEAINQQLEQEPDDDEARRLLIQIQMRLLPRQELTPLLTEFDKLSKMSVADWQTKSIILERSGEIAEAIEAIETARKLAPHDERLSEGLLGLLLLDEKYEDALKLVRSQEQSWRWLEREGDVLVLLGNDVLATARYGLVLAHLEGFEGIMREDYLQALKIRVILARAHAYRRLEYFDTAKELYFIAEAISGEDVTIQFNLGLIAQMEGDTDKAEKICSQALIQAAQGLKTEMIAALDEDSRFASLKQALGV